VPGLETRLALNDPAYKASMDETRVINVEIHGQPYPIRTTLEPAYVAELAAYVDMKMRAASRETTAGDTLKIAVLAALNIADECFRIQHDEQERRERLSMRAEELERMLDSALGFELGPADAVPAPALRQG
jgi:cell division protein ZapA